MESMTEFSTALAHGVWAIDTRHQRADAGSPPSLHEQRQKDAQHELA